MDHLLLGGYQAGRSSKAQIKLSQFKLSRSNPVLVELFRSSKNSKSLSKATDDKLSKIETVIRTKMTKGNLRAVIARRFNGVVAERVVSKLPEFAN